MAGHRRISTDLFLEYANSRSQAWKVAALLSLDLDEFKGGILSISAYARIWGKNRDTVRKLISQWKGHKSDCYAGNRPDSLPTPERQASDTPSDTQNAKNSRTSGGPNDTRSDTSPTLLRQASDTILEQEPEQEGKDTSPSRSPSARKQRRIGASDSRIRELDTQVEDALAKAPTESQERRAERKARLKTLGEMFLACSRVPDEAQLRAYFRSTIDLPTRVLECACDAARTATVGTFAPDEKTILAEGRKIEARARKRARQDGDVSPLANS